MTASLLHAIKCSLGEGAFWHAIRKSFFWVDIDGKSLHSYHLENKEVNTWRFLNRPSFIADMGHDQLLLAFQGGLGRFDISTGNLEWMMDLEKDIPDNRTNDGAIDRSGRLWLGTMNTKFKEGAGSLFCISSDLQVEKKVNALSIPNGLVWSADDRLMYHIDSPTRKVQAYQFDTKTGTIQFQKTAITIPDHLGSPDGMCIDAEGMLWIAHWNGFGVYRWNPQLGTLIDKIEVPVPQVSSCAFGGDQLDQLFITTAREGFGPDESERYPDSGSIYITTPGVRGVKKNVFGGSTT